MKHLLTILTFLGLYSIALSQEIKSEDIYQYMGSYSSHEAFHRNAMGGYYIAGKGTGSIDFDHGPGENNFPEDSSRDLFLAHYDKDNVLQWLRVLDGDQGTNEIRDIVSDEEGNIYLCGTFMGNLSLGSNGQNTLSNSGESNAWIAKLDAEGELIWHFALGEESAEQVPEKLFIVNQKLRVQLTYSGTFDVDPGPGTSMLDDNSNAMLEYDFDGNLIQAYSHKRRTGVRASVVDSEGNLYLGGTFSGLATFDYKSNASVFANGLFDAYIVKYDSDFNLLWLKRVALPSEELQFYQLALDENSDLLAIGEFAAGAMIGSQMTENDGEYLVHMSQNGEFTNISELYPESSLVTHLFLNDAQQIILQSRFSEAIDSDLSEGVEEHLPMDEHDNLLISIYENDLSLYDSKHIYAPLIHTVSAEFGTDGKLDVLMDFEGEGKVVYGSNGTYVSQESEDFVHYRVNIEGCSTSEGEISLEGCESVEVNGELFESSGTYEQVLTNSEGCDSLLTITIVTHPTYSLEADIQACESFEVDGMILTESGNYTLNLSTNNGCDSTIALTLDIVTINDAVTQEDMQLISEEQEGDAYQWYDCASNEPIANATDRIFSPEISGQYQVEIIKESCVTSSDCIEYTIVNTQEFELEFYYAPNPSDGIFHLKSENYMDNIDIEIRDLSGRMVQTSFGQNSSSVLDLSHLAPGVYVVKSRFESSRWYQRVLVY